MILVQSPGVPARAFVFPFMRSELKLVGLRGELVSELCRSAGDYFPRDLDYSKGNGSSSERPGR